MDIQTFFWDNFHAGEQTGMLPFLICFPLLTALILLLVRGNTARSIIVVLASIVIAGGSMMLVFARFPMPALMVELPRST